MSFISFVVSIHISFMTKICVSYVCIYLKLLLISFIFDYLIYLSCSMICIFISLLPYCVIFHNIYFAYFYFLIISFLYFFIYFHIYFFVCFLFLASIRMPCHLFGCEKIHRETWVLTDNKSMFAVTVRFVSSCLYIDYVYVLFWYMFTCLVYFCVYVFPCLWVYRNMFFFISIWRIYKHYFFFWYLNRCDIFTEILN